MDRNTRVPHSQENAAPQNPTVGLYLGSWGGPRGLSVFFWARYPCSSPEEAGGGVSPLSIHLTESVYKVALQKSFSAQIRPPILYISNNKGYVDGYVKELTFAN